MNWLMRWGLILLLNDWSCSTNLHYLIGWWMNCNGWRQLSGSCTLYDAMTSFDERLIFWFCIRKSRMLGGQDVCNIWWFCLRPYTRHCFRYTWMFGGFFPMTASQCWPLFSSKELKRDAETFCASKYLVFLMSSVCWLLSFTQIQPPQPADTNVVDVVCNNWRNEWEKGWYTSVRGPIWLLIILCFLLYGCWLYSCISAGRSHHSRHHVWSLQYFDRAEDREHCARTTCKVLWASEMLSDFSMPVWQKNGVDIADLHGMFRQIDHETISSDFLRHETSRICTVFGYELNFVNRCSRMIPTTICVKWGRTIILSFCTTWPGWTSWQCGWSNWCCSLKNENPSTIRDILAAHHQEDIVFVLPRFIASPEDNRFPSISFSSLNSLLSVILSIGDRRSAWMKLLAFFPQISEKTIDFMIRRWCGAWQVWQLSQYRSANNAGVLVKTHLEAWILWFIISHGSWHVQNVLPASRNTDTHRTSRLSLRQW